jgi:hypothetical protein
MLHASSLFALFAGVVLAFHDVVGASRGLFFRDHTMVFKPRWQFVLDCFSRGELPFAPNPANPTGAPFEMLLNATYTPQALIFFIAPFDVAYDWFVASNYVVLAFGIYALALSLGATRIEALAAAAVGALSGPVLAEENLLVNIQSLSFAPWVLWAWRRLLVRRSAGNAAIFAIAAAFHAQGLMPEFLWIDLAGAILILRAVRPRIDAPLIATIALAGVLAFAIAAVEVLPAFARTIQTRRGHGFSYEDSALIALQPLQLLELIAPSFWSPPEAPMIQLKAFVPYTPPYLTSLYAGSSLALAAASFGARSERKRAAIFGVLALIALLTAIASPLPFYRLVHALPLFQNSRYPVKYMILFAAAISALMPIALRATRARPNALVYAAAVQIALVGGMLIAARTPELKQWLSIALDDRRAISVSGLSHADYPAIALKAMEPRLLHALFFSGAMLVAGLWAAFGRDRDPSPIAAAILLLDLSSAARFTILGADIEPKGPPAEIQAKLVSDRARYYAIEGGTPVPHREDRTYFEEQVVSWRSRGGGGLLGARPFRDQDMDAVSNRASSLSFRMLYQLKEDRALRLLQRAGVSWIVTDSPRAEPSAIAFAVQGEAPEYLVPLAHARPYVSTYDRAMVVDVEPPLVELAKALTDASTASVAVVMDRALERSSLLSPAARASARADLESVSGDRSTFSIAADSDGPALVVLQELLEPGWTGSIDGLAAPLHLVDVGYMGIEIPAGKHRVTFRYEGLTPKLAPLSAIALLMAVALVIVDRLFKVRQR